MPKLHKGRWPRSILAARKYLPLALPLLFLLPGIFSFPYPSDQAQFSDMAITHYPNAIYLRHAIATWRVLPLWSPLILSGYPFVANPLAGIWYLPGWLAYVFPLPFGFNLLIAAHLLFGGIGMYKLLRAEKLAHVSALFGALAFEALPKLFAHYGAGHLSLLYAIPWTPWLLLAWKAPGLGVWIGRRRHRIPAGALLAMIFVADVRWAAYAGLLWLAYALTFDPSKVDGTRMHAILSRLKSAAWQLILAALLAGPLAFPLLEYTRLSTRAEMAAQDVFAYSLPPARLLGLVIPDFGGFQEYALYPGIFVLLLAALGTLLGGARRAEKFWRGAAGLSLIFALGDSLPLMTRAAGLPGFNLLRVPSRALFVSGMAFAILAAFSLDRLLVARPQGDSEPGRYLRRSRLFLAGVLAFVIVFFLGVWLLTNSLPVNFGWSCLMVGGAWIWYELLVGKRLAPQYAGWVLIGLCLIDLGAVDLAAYSPRPVADVIGEARSVIEALPVSGQSFRLYSPSYSLPQQTAATNGIELADGVDPLQLKSYVDFMRRASGVEWQGYSVTLPAFSNGEPHSDNASARPDPAMLALLNVRYLVSAFELQIPDWVELQQQDGIWIYENRKALARAWLQPEAAPAGAAAYPVDSIQWSPNRITIAASVPKGSSESQLLVLSELVYPGWQVRVDGQPAQMVAEAGLLRSVVLSPGGHEVVFRFWPASLTLGLVAAFCGGLLAAWSGNRQEKDLDFV